MSEDRKPALRVVAPSAWSASLALLLADEPFRVCAEEGGLSSLRARLHRSSRDLLALHVTTHNVNGTGDFLVSLATDCPHVRAVVVGEMARRWEWSLREIGAVAVVRFVWETPTMARIVRRHFRDLPRSDAYRETLHRVLQQLR